MARRVGMYSDRVTISPTNMIDVFNNHWLHFQCPPGCVVIKNLGLIMMTTSIAVSHIMLGVSPDSQNKHKVKSPLSTSADVALVDGASMSQSRPKKMWPHNSQQ